MSDDEILLVLKSQGWNPAPYVEMDEDEIIAFARAIAAAAVEKCIRAVDDAGGDNTQYHIDAIRGRTTESESEGR